MRAIGIYAFGPPGQLTGIDIPQPVPSGHEVLIEMHATSITPADCRIRAGSRSPLAFNEYTFPLIPGTSVAGVVAGAGNGVSRFKPGDEVFGLKSAAEGGAYAEYALASENVLALKPRNVTFEEAATIPAAGLAAWQALASARVSSRDRVLVHDGAGSTGSFAVQLAKVRGATVIATFNGDDPDTVWSMGADQAINSRGQDFAAILGQSIDVVIDTSGGQALNKSFAVLAPGGRLVSTFGMLDPARAAAQGISAAFLTPAADPFQLAEVARLIAERRLKPLIGQILPFSGEGLRSAHMLSESGHARGIIVIKYIF